MFRFAFLTAALLFSGCSEYDLKPDDDGVDDPNDPPGPNPDIKVDPLSMSFGIKVPNCPTNPKFVTISNVGDADLEVDRIRLGGDASAYTLQAGPMVLAPGESDEISIDFLAATTTVYNGTIRIESNDPDEEVVVVDVVGEGGANPYNEDVFQQESPGSVDVLWVLDNSCSMSDKLTALEQAFDGFITNFVSLGLDYQIGVVTTDMDNPAQSGKLQGPTPVMSSLSMSQSQIVTAFDLAVEPNASGSGNEKALGAMHAALESPGYALTAGLVRADANLAVIVVGDEDDGSSNSVAFYTAWMDGMKPDPDQTTISGIIQQNTSLFNFNCAGVGSPKLQGVIDQTGGLRASICDVPATASGPSPAFNQVLTWLSFTAAGLTTQFDLSEVPAAGAAGMTVTVDGVNVPFNPLQTSGFSYNIALNAVFFHGQDIPGPTTRVVVTYPIAATCGT